VSNVLQFEAQADDDAPALPGLEPPTFDDFWRTYPRKVQKRDALRAWNGATKRAAPDVIVAAAQRYREDPNLPIAGWIPYPATWLNRDSWLDGPCEPRSGGAAATGSTLRHTESAYSDPAADFGMPTD
jgi:hypothetical protein